MFLSRVDVLLGAQGLKSPCDTEPRVPGFNNIIDIAQAGGLIRIGKIFAVFFLLILDELGTLLLILDLLDFLALQDFHSALASHHSNLGTRPCIVDVTSQLLTAHHIVGTSV